MRTMFKVLQRPPSALLHLAAQPMQAMVLPLVQGCWGLASEPWSAVRSHRKRCTSRRRRRSTTHRLHLFTSRRLSTWRPSTLGRGITVVRIEVIGARASNLSSMPQMRNPASCGEPGLCQCGSVIQLRQVEGQIELA